MNINTVIVKASDLQQRNQIHMNLVEGDATHFFPIDRIQLLDGKIVCEIHNTKFPFDPEQLVQVKPSSLFRDQRQKISGIDAVRRTDQSRPEGKVQRTYKADGKEGEVILRRNTKLKMFEIGAWPAWLPKLDSQVRHAFEFSKSWPMAERLLSALTGAMVESGDKRFIEDGGFAFDPRLSSGAENAQKRENKLHAHEAETLADI